MSKLSTLLMHRYALTLVLSVAILALKTVSASPSAFHYGSEHVDYYKQVADSDSYSDVDTESDSDGPYADGHWVWTDRGWYWDSDEDFGWATYHYGRWVLVEDAGWIWIPGTNWAPAWVSWRHSDNDDYVGWAPLPPESRFNPQIGFHGWSDSYYDIGPAAYAFIRIADFARPSYREFYIPPQQNVEIIQRTTNITNITYQNNVINNFGPQHERIALLVQERSGQTLPTYKLNYTAQTQRDAAFKTAVQGNQL